MKRAEYIALGLVAAVAWTVWSQRDAEAEPEKKGVPDSNLEQARILIRRLETDPNIPPAAAIAQLENAASLVASVSPEAAAELRASAERIRARGGAPPAPTPPGPAPTPPAPPAPPTADAHVQAARLLIQTIESNPLIPPAEKARQLLAAAGQAEPHSAEAAKELRDAAARHGGTPAPGPTPIEAAAAAGPSPKLPALFERFRVILARVHARPDLVTAADVDELDRTAAELAAAGAVVEADILTKKSTELRTQKDLPRAVAQTL